MNPRLIAAVSITIASSLAHADTISHLVQWKSSDGGNDHWYSAISVSGGITWTDAQAEATAAGGYLATITSSEENAFIFDLLNRWSGWGNPWIGGFQPNPSSRSDEGWDWVTGEVWSYSNWANGEPNDWGGIFGAESYLGFRRSDGTWNDLPNQGDGGATFAYVVEWTSNPIPTPAAFSLLALGCLCTRRRK